jgi:predicted DNA-binding ribbon-helix-helix protein
MAKIPLPNDKFVSSDYNILFPDSLYSSAKITLRKVRIEGMRKSFSCQMRIEQGAYKEIKFVVKGKKRLTFLVSELSGLFPTIALSSDTRFYCLNCTKQTMSLSIRKLGRKYELTLSQNACVKTTL